MPLVEGEEPTLRVVQSQVLQALDRAPDLGSRVERQEHLRCELLNALERGFSAPPPPRREVRAVPAAPVPEVARAAPAMPRFRRRSHAPIFAIVVALAIALGLAVDGRHTRAEMRAHVTRTVQARFFARRAAMRSAAPSHPGS